MKNRNHEGYADPTATEAIQTISNEEKQVHTLVHAFRDIAALAGFSIVGYDHRYSILTISNIDDTLESVNNDIR